MTSPKQKAANRRNALRSSGPKSEAGLRRSAVNSLKHGLTAPIESSEWGHKIDALQELLGSEGIEVVEARELALRLAEYERNVQYQRQRFQEDMTGLPRPQVIPDGAKSDLAVASEIGALVAQKRTHVLGMDRKLAREIQKYLETSAAKQMSEAKRDAARDINSADRYLRRAANQLIKLLKS